MFAKHFKLLFATLFISLFSACVSTIPPYAIKDGYSTSKPVTGSIDKGLRMAEKYPDDDILLLSCRKTIDFTLNTDPGLAEDWDKRFQKETFIKDITWTNQENREYTLPINEYLTSNESEQLRKHLESYTLSYYMYARDSSTIKEYISQNIRADRNKLPDGDFFFTQKAKYEVLNMKDFNSLRVVLPYHQTSTISNIRVNESRYKFVPVTYDLPYTSNGIFYSDSRFKAFSVNLAVTGNETGYEYLETSRDARFKSVFYIREDHMSLVKEIEINIPEWLDVEIIEKNFKGIEYSRTKEKIYPDSKKKKSKDAVVHDGPVSCITYKFLNLKASAHSQNTRGISYNEPHLMFVYKGIKKDGEKKPVFSSVADLYSWYKAVSTDGRNNTDKIKPFTEELVKDAANDEEKVKRIFYWIQDNVQYIAFEDGIAGFRPDNCNSVFEKRYGDCKGMANLAKHMLQSVGIDGRLVWLGTRHLNYDYSTPGLAVDNHAICAVKLGDQYRYIDPTETYCAYGDYAHRIQGRKVIIEDGDDFILDSVPEFGPEHNTEKSIETYSLSGRLISGKVEKTYTGESKIGLIRQYNSLKSEDKHEALATYLNPEPHEMAVSNIHSSDLENREQDIKLSYDLQVKNHVYTLNNILFLNIEWTGEFENHTIDTLRRADYNFGLKMLIDRQASVKLPEGYSIQSLPAPVSIDNPYFSFNLSAQASGNSIVYTKKLVIKQGYLPASEYMAWNNAIEKLRGFYTDFVQLKPVNK